ncbi:MAG TPA: RNA 2',3'-cyclic phosphodiesterase [Planctomycetaceae bacterium]|nr:RNA 2',3'-cyclic phosphodiesterase [Planctomycetaceae bacterium]
MPRLFLAIDFPDPVLDELADLQQPAQAGVRWISPAQMHLTVHFLGDTGLESVKAALTGVRTRAFELNLESVGQFRCADGGTILWTGVRPTAFLKDLHSETARALGATGFCPESRPYSPHLTLARCRRETSRPFLRAWLNRHRDFAGAAFIVDHVTLYSSLLQPAGPVYQPEQAITLYG